jgi:stage V sporulation protein R
MSELLFQGDDWDFDIIRRIVDACAPIATEELGLSIYQNQIEIVSTEQMLDAYCSIGMPLMYAHWSFGKHFMREESRYKRGGGLAYELVINSDPCISYNMEDNTAIMQTMVIAHAAFGHNHFFKNNYLFKQWTDAAGILDYLNYAKNFVASCEKIHGEDEVRLTLDAAHSIMDHGVFKYPRKVVNFKDELRRREEHREYEIQTYNDLWRTLPAVNGPAGLEVPKAMDEKYSEMLGLPEENILYFLEKHSPRLNPWQREILRIVRNIAQYFYPQIQTKVMNEGAACFTHYKILRRLHDKGQISDGSYIEFLKHHSAVTWQRPYSAFLNPYALGFRMMQDIERIAEDPTEEDREWFPSFAGRGDGIGVVRDAWANYRDESFVNQFLSPKVMRDMRLFHVTDDPDDEEGLLVGPTHEERGYRRLRKALAQHYDIGNSRLDIEVSSVDILGDRTMRMVHNVKRRNTLDEEDAAKVVQHIANLWGYRVSLTEISDGSTGEEYSARPTNSANRLLAIASMVP